MMGEGTDSLLPAVNSAGDVVLQLSFSVYGRKNTKLTAYPPQYHDKDHVRSICPLAIL